MRWASLSWRVAVRVLRGAILAFVAASMPTFAFALNCPKVEALGPKPTRLIAVIPSPESTASDWEPLLAFIRKDPQHEGIAWLFIDTELYALSPGHARDVATAIGGCIHEKVNAKAYTAITLVGHSMGGMLARYAYLEAAGSLVDRRANENSWAHKVDSVVLFASTNKGVTTDYLFPLWPFPTFIDWLIRSMPIVVSDMFQGSNFIAEVRIAWIRHFARQAKESSPRLLPSVVQFWGTEDKIVNATDNADLEAFIGRVRVDVPEAGHYNVFRLDVRDPDTRWELMRKHFFGEAPRPVMQTYSDRRVLVLLRGIRDSAFSEWIEDLRKDGKEKYGYDDVKTPEYGHFSAWRFARQSERLSISRDFLDKYATWLAENPLTTFDFIGHSNGTYALAYALSDTPSVRFNNVVLVAPVLPTDFNWRDLFKNGQVQKVRYDVALDDKSVGLLCPALRALFQSDVGPAGVLGFGEGRPVDTNLVRQVGYYTGGHGAALIKANREHLLSFAKTGNDYKTCCQMNELGALGWQSRLTPYVVWLVALLVAVLIWKLFIHRWDKVLTVLALLSVAAIVGLKVY